jgi:N-acyl-phosphatidylethanolamine-hydrolysing phospholipase D
LGERGHTKIAPSPAFGSLPTRAPAIVTPRAAPGYRSATWVGHSTVLLQLGSLNILTDPVWSERASPVQWIGPRRLMPPAVDFDALPEIDVVLLSHNHYDHLDAATARRIGKRFPGAQWLCPLGLAELLQSWGIRHVTERDWWQSVDTPAFAVTCTPAQHFSARGLRDRNDTLWCGWTIDTGDTRVYFAGDSALHPEFQDIAEKLGPFDLVMLPIGAYEPRWFMRAVHMNPEDAIDAYRALTANGDERPPCLALHWGTFRLTDEPVEEPPARFTRLWNDAGLPPAAAWVLAHGETRHFNEL